MIGKKKYVTMLTVFMFLASLAMVNVPVKSSPSPVTFAVDMPSQGYISGVPVDTTFSVDILVNASGLTNNAAGSMVGYQIDVQVDPAVLQPLGSSGGVAGYFLKDFQTIYYTFGYSVNILLGSTPEEMAATGYMDEVTGQITPTPPTGAGGNGTLVTLWFKSLSETAYTPIQISIFEGDVWEAGWMDTTGTWHDAATIDGHYNAPPFFEANLVRKSAWPEHHHFDRSKSGDPNVYDSHGTPGNQTLYAKVRNLGPTPVTLKVEFELKHGDDVPEFNTTETVVAPGEIINIMHDLTGSGSWTVADDGTWTVLVKCWYYNPFTDVWSLGTKTKAFKFSVVA